MRSVIKRADAGGIGAIVDQQFEVGRQILAAGLMPILEPEVDIHSPDKAAAEKLLRDRLVAGLDSLGAGEQVMFKLTLPDEDNFYLDLVNDDRVLKVVALSGGYSRDVANDKLSRNRGVIASFSRALTDGLRADQDDDEYNRVLNATIQSIYEASLAPA
jgi:fructose-bisphosphate aldolase, class I